VKFERRRAKERGGSGEEERTGRVCEILDLSATRHFKTTVHFLVKRDLRITRCKINNQTEV
jgi:hypothetical protein